MVKLLLLASSMAFLIGCSCKPVKETVYISTPVACPTIQIESFTYKINPQTYNITSVDGLICLTSDEFIGLSTHTHYSRTSYNQLMEHIKEFNKSVEDKNNSMKD